MFSINNINQNVLSFLLDIIIAITMSNTNTLGHLGLDANICS